MDTRPFVQAFQELNTSFVKMLDSLSALRALSSMPVRDLSDRKLLESALAILVENQDLERCSVFLLQEGRLVNAAGLDWEDLIFIRTASGERPPRSRVPITFSLGEGVVGLAAQSGLVQRCANCSEDQRFIERCALCLPGTSDTRPDSYCLVGSLLSVPIKMEGEVLGVLNLSHPHPDFFKDEHERALIIFCNVLGQLLANHRLLSHMNDLVHERTHQLEVALAETERLKRLYEEMSVIDELTLLHNRRFFFPECRSALSRAMRNDEPFCVILLDIDHFKHINDAFGHAAGDEALRRIAEVLKRECREGDVLARFGGEEFVVALPNTDQVGAKRLAERIRNAVKVIRMPIGGRTLSMTTCVGIAALEAKMKGDSQVVLDKLLLDADQALYFGKENGRDQCCLFSDIACEL